VIDLADTRGVIVGVGYSTRGPSNALPFTFT
jgi:hypothetical protein